MRRIMLRQRRSLVSVADSLSNGQSPRNVTREMPGEEDADIVSKCFGLQNVNSSAYVPSPSQIRRGA